MKNFKSFIKEAINLDIDPYGEENWGEENLNPPLNIEQERALRDGRNIKVCRFQQNFPGLDNNYPDGLESVRLSDYYNYMRDTFTCPHCGKVSRQIMQHGDGWICGDCGTKTRVFGNALRYWR